MDMLHKVSSDCVVSQKILNCWRIQGVGIKISESSAALVQDGTSMDTANSQRQLEFTISWNDDDL